MVEIKGVYVAVGVCVPTYIHANIKLQIVIKCCEGNKAGYSDRENWTRPY